MKPPVFLLGCHKSGTSLLRSLLDGHEDFFVFPKETHFFQYANFWVDYSLRRNYPKKPFSAKKSFLEYIKRQNHSDDPFSDNNYFRGYNFDRFNSFFDEKDVTDLRILMEKYWMSLYYSLTNNENGFENTFVEKSVENAEFACVLRHFFPKCKFVHIIRNPYATIVSIRRMKSGSGFPYLSKLIHSMNNSYYHLFKNTSYMEDYLVIKYEDLVLKSDYKMREICDFLKIKFSSKLLIPTYSDTIWSGNSTSGEKFDGISKKAVYTWRNIITPLEAKIVNSLFIHVLERFGYERFDHNGNWLMPNKNERLKTYFKNRLLFVTDYGVNQ